MTMGNKKILISQSEPRNLAPYEALTEKFGAQIDFVPFYLIEPLTSLEFRAQRINITEYTAVVFSARHTIDAFFKLCEELRVKVPESMKYFCTTEAVALYLQKHIVYRKRKIFFGDRTPQSVMNQIGTKHRDEKFLITASDTSSNDALTSLFDKAGLTYTVAKFVKGVPQDLKAIDLNNYDIAVVYNSADVKSIQTNFPDFKAKNVQFLPFSHQALTAVEEAGLPVATSGPSPQAPSVAKALELYLSKD